MFLALVKVTLVDTYIYFYCYYVHLCESALLHVCMFIYTVVVHSSRQYT